MLGEHLIKMLLVNCSFSTLKMEGNSKESMESKLDEFDEFAENTDSQSESSEREADDSIVNENYWSPNNAEKRLAALDEKVRQALELLSVDVIIHLLVEASKIHRKTVNAKLKSMKENDALYRLTVIKLRWIGCTTNFLIAFRNAQFQHISIASLSSVPECLTNYLNSSENDLADSLQHVIDVVIMKGEKANKMLEGLKSRRVPCTVDESERKGIYRLYHDLVGLYKKITGAWTFRGDRAVRSAHPPQRRPQPPAHQPHDEQRDPVPRHKTVKFSTPKNSLQQDHPKEYSRNSREHREENRNHAPRRYDDYPQQRPREEDRAIPHSATKTNAAERDRPRIIMKRPNH